jgi:hypothetical protein
MCCCIFLKFFRCWFLSIGRSTTGNKVTTSTAATILTLAFTLALESNETLPPLQEAEHAAAASSALPGSGLVPTSAMSTITTTATNSNNSNNNNSSSTATATATATATVLSPTSSTTADGYIIDEEAAMKTKPATAVAVALVSNQNQLMMK